jgi:PAS domain S-box-containing protein
LELDIKTVFNSNYDVIYSSDAQGITRKVSNACERIWGLRASDMIGNSVYDLEKDGVYQPSVTRLVLETNRRIQSFQVTKTGRKLLVVGTPVRNSSGKIAQVINVSREITSEAEMIAEIKCLNQLVNAYRRELDGISFLNETRDKLIYVSEEMNDITRKALKVSSVDASVLITGESGVGKEVIASFIHSSGTRKNEPFIKINCGAIPESLLESELFGYDYGAFTGANKSGKLGMFELAHKGTLFLDEISEMPLNMQVKLLRVLQDKAFMRVGGTKPISVDVRIIAASNRNLQAEVAKGRFRQDLFYRLNVVPIHIPALRDRPEDIVPLTMFFLNRYNSQYNKAIALDADAVRCFQDCRWSGNIRELQNIVESLVVLTDNDLIRRSDLPGSMCPDNAEKMITVNGIMPLKKAVDCVEQQLISMAMAKFKTTTKVAEALGVDQSTVSRKMKRLT